MFKVYLAGAISGLTYGEGQEWRAYARDVLQLKGIHAYSPLRAKGFLRDYGVLTGGYEGNPMASDRGIMTRDSFDVATSDLILVNLLGAKSVSVGTCIEFGLAYAARKPVVCVMEPSGNLHDHPMVREAIGYRVPELDAALAVVQAILLPHADGDL